MNVKNNDFTKKLNTNLFKDNEIKEFDKRFSNELKSNKKIINRRKNQKENVKKYQENKFEAIETTSNMDSKLVNKFSKMTQTEKIKAINDILKYTDLELNDLDYNEAISVDKRNFMAYYFSLLKTQHLLILSFWPVENDYNSRIIKIFLFFFMFAIYYTVNAFFFDDNTLHQINEDGGNFNFIYQIPQMLFSSLISFILNTLIQYLSLSIQYITKIKKDKNIKMIKGTKKIFNNLNYRFLLFFIISFILLLFFWYYLACFSAIYKNTQIHLIKDTVISFGFSFLSSFGLFLIPGMFRIPSLKKKNKKCLYMISKIIETFI